MESALARLVNGHLHWLKVVFLVELPGLFQIVLSQLGSEETSYVFAVRPKHSPLRCFAAMVVHPKRNVPDLVSNKRWTRAKQQF